MKTLIIYDDTGLIYLTMSGTYLVPQGGVQYLEVEIPEGKILKNIDVTVNPNVPIYEDIPLTEIEVLKKRIEEQDAALVELASLVGGTV